jgi:hypothetical protein
MMNSQAIMSIDPARYTLRLDGVTAIVPCISVVLCLDETDPAGIQEFHDRGLEVLGGAVTHYRAEQMKRRGPITARVRKMLQTWLAKPAPGKQYYLEYIACPDDHGVTAAGLSIHMTPRSYAEQTPEFRKTWLASWQKLYDQGVRHLLPCTVLRLTVPLDHALAHPDSLLTWMTGLRLVGGGAFGSGYAGYALNYHSSVASMEIDRVMNARLAAIVLQHPGFDWHNTYLIVERLLPFNPSTGDFLPLIKRANWVCLLSERMIAHLGGGSQLAESLVATPGITTRDVGTGMLVRAGMVPQIGDIPRGDAIPMFRSVAKVLRPVRMDSIDGLGSGFPDERAQEWLDAFDGGIPA